MNAWARINQEPLPCGAANRWFSVQPVVISRDSVLTGPTAAINVSERESGGNFSALGREAHIRPWYVICPAAARDCAHSDIG